MSRQIRQTAIKDTKALAQERLIFTSPNLVKADTIPNIEAKNLMIKIIKEP